MINVLLRDTMQHHLKILWILNHNAPAQVCFRFREVERGGRDRKRRGRNIYRERERKRETDTDRARETERGGERDKERERFRKRERSGKVLCSLFFKLFLLLYLQVSALNLPIASNYGLKLLPRSPPTPPTPPPFQPNTVTKWKSCSVASH